MFASLLIATDGSDCAERAARYGLELAALYDAAVEFIHVLPTGDEEQAASVADDLLDDLLTLAADAGVTADTHVTSGTPSKTILARAAEGDYDCIVMGRRGRAGLGEHLLGTVTDRILRRTDRPVLTAPEGERPVAYENLLLTTDGSKNAERAIPLAGDIAGRAAADLHLLSVVDIHGAAGAFDAGGLSKDYVARLTDETEAALDSAARQVADVETVTVVRQGTPHEEIAAYADAEEIDLVVMATRGKTNLTGQYLGGTTGRVLRTVDAPVLVVR